MIEAIVIGASAGGVEALSAILPSLPRSYPLPLMIVLHVPSHASSLLTEVFQPKCALRIKEAEPSERLESGTAYVAPPNYHVLVEPDRTLGLSIDDPVLYSRPSIDVLFESASYAYGPGLLGVVLTGASSDGSEGLRHVVRGGGKAIVQNPATAAFPVMPRSALEMCPEAEPLELSEIAARLLILAPKEVA